LQVWSFPCNCLGLPRVIIGVKITARMVGCAAILAAAACLHAVDYKKAPGPQKVEVLRLEWQDASRKRAVPVKIYYPAQATGACPVIIFSHGLGGTRETYEYLGRHWASHGYVPAHLQHAGSDDAVWRGATRPMETMRGALTDWKNAVNRPLDARFAIDELTRQTRPPAHSKAN
jgi:predicted dienelactone hydrolase